jgi:sugar phosphate isomerase/epimerase
MKSAITISLVPQSKGGPFVFWDGLADGCARAAALGFDAVEIFPPSAAAIDVAELSRLLAQHKLALAALGTGAGWVVHKWTLTHADAEVRGKACDFVRAIVDAAGGIGAPAILGSMQGRWEGEVSRPQALDWLAEALRELGAQAATHGQVLLYEPLNRYETNLFNSAAEAAAFLDERGLAHVKLLCDLFHMNIEEVSIADTLRKVAPRLGHVHFADSNRRAIGLGHTEMEPIMTALREIGYDGYLSAEVLPLPDAQAAAEQTMRAFRQYTGT